MMSETTRSSVRIGGTPSGAPRSAFETMIRVVGALSLLALPALFGCGSADIKASVGTSDSTPSEPTDKGDEAKPPPKKKCESLADGCEGEPGVRVRIANTGQSIVPVKGWAYAQEADGTIAQQGDAGPAFAAVGFDASDPKQEAANRDAAVDTLAKKIGVTLPKRKIPWAKPLDNKTLGDVKLALGQAEGAARSDKKGPILWFTAPLGEGKALVGIAFVPSDDSSDSDVSLMESIDTIAPAEEK
jgi:hypothetical protein